MNLREQLHAPQEDQAWTSHHDLKPENILIDTGRVAITDFGMSHLKPIAEGSGVTSSRVLGTSEYAPPEAFDESGGRAKKQHGRAVDVWSMRCIMMEIAVIICYGHDHETKNIKAFRKDLAELPVERRPFPMHELSAKSFYNSIPVIDGWLKTMQSEETLEERDNGQFSRYLRIMIGMLRGKPGGQTAVLGGGPRILRSPTSGRFGYGEISKRKRACAKARQEQSDKDTTAPSRREWRLHLDALPCRCWMV